MATESSDLAVSDTAGTVGIDLKDPNGGYVPAGEYPVDAPSSGRELCRPTSTTIRTRIS